MIQNFDQVQKLSKEGVDATMESFAVATKSAQAIAGEFADYAKKSFEEGTSAFEKLLAARSLDRALEVQTEYAKSAYEGFVAQATKFGEIYADAAKQAYKPLQGYAGKMSPVA
jgi:phasin family protein